MLHLVFAENLRTKEHFRTAAMLLFYITQNICKNKSLIFLIYYHI
jgi:hypothetical protein